MLSMLAAAAMLSCSAADGKVNFVEINPGHFHAALVLKSMYPEVSKDVRVYAPLGPELNAHTELVRQFNTRTTDPTSWNEIVYTGADFLEKAIAESKPGDVVILAGRNDLKPDYFLAAAKAGLHVIADKPMGIDDAAFAKFEETMRIARGNGVIIDDVMTERHDIFSLVQRALIHSPSIYGLQLKGTAAEPAVEKASVHHFCKEVNGKPLQRPEWYYDVRQQGCGLVDVTSHIVDIFQWSLFPDQAIAKSDVKMLSAKAWDTPITADDYRLSTGRGDWPDYLKGAVDTNNVLRCEANGEFVYTLKGVVVRCTVVWNFMPPAGSGDTGFSVMRGSRGSVSIRQNKDTGFKPAMFVKMAEGQDKAAYSAELERVIAELAKTYPGLALGEESAGEWRILVPADGGHESHFAFQVREFLDWLKFGNRPAWEAQNLETKYWTLHEAWKLSRRK